MKKSNKNFCIKIIDGYKVINNKIHIDLHEGLHEGAAGGGYGLGVLHVDGQMGSHGLESGLTYENIAEFLYYFFADFQLQTISRAQ